MGCIYHHCSLLLPPSLESCTNKNSTRSRETGTLWLKCTPNNQLLGIGGGKGLLLQHFPTRQPQPPNTSSLFLSLTSPASSGDYSILLPARYFWPFNLFSTHVFSCFLSSFCFWFSPSWFLSHSMFPTCWRYNCVQSIEADG